MKNKKTQKPKKSSGNTGFFTNAKHILLTAVILTVVICICIALGFYVKNISQNTNSLKINLYYINPAEHTVEPEARTIQNPGTEKLLFQSVADEFFAGSKSTNKMLYLPDSLKCLSASLDADTALIDLDKSYTDLEISEKIMTLAAVVYTFTELDFVSSVDVTVAGSPVSETQGNQKFDRENVKLNPSIDPEKKNWQMVKLYFADKTGTKLVSEEKSIEVKQSLTLEYQIVDQLIGGPDESSLKALVPAETKIKDIKTEDGICYVNLSNEFITKTSANADQNTLLVYSIVNSLTELDYVNKVQFLIEGEKVNAFSADFDFSKPFDRNADLID